MTVIYPAELGAAECATWRSFQRVLPDFGSAYLAPEMDIAAGIVRQGTRVAILEDAAQTIGFFPPRYRGADAVSRRDDRLRSALAVRAAHRQQGDPS